jgi:hypothetical protein
MFRNIGFVASNWSHRNRLSERATEHLNRALELDRCRASVWLRNCVNSVDPLTSRATNFKLAFRLPNSIRPRIAAPSCVAEPG